jgi:hypothetical protein
MQSAAPTGSGQLNVLGDREQRSVYCLKGREGRCSARELITTELDSCEVSQCCKLRRYSARELIAVEAQVTEPSQCPKQAPSVQCP